VPLLDRRWPRAVVFEATDGTVSEVFAFRMISKTRLAIIRRHGKLDQGPLRAAAVATGNSVALAAGACYTVPIRSGVDYLPSRSSLHLLHNDTGRREDRTALPPPGDRPATRPPVLSYSGSRLAAEFTFLPAPALRHHEGSIFTNARVDLGVPAGFSALQSRLHGPYHSSLVAPSRPSSSPQSLLLLPSRPSIVARLDASSLASDESLGVHLTRTSAS
jgi:hypothetical protein